MTYDAWKQTDTIGEQLHADDDAVEAMRRDAAEARASAVLSDITSLNEAIDEGRISLAFVLKCVTSAPDWMPQEMRMKAYRMAHGELLDALTASYAATLTDDEIRAYIRDERERARMDTEE